MWNCNSVFFCMGVAVETNGSLALNFILHFFPHGLFSLDPDKIKCSYPSLDLITVPYDTSSIFSQRFKKNVLRTARTVEYWSKEILMNWEGAAWLLLSVSYCIFLCTEPVNRSQLFIWFWQHKQRVHSLLTFHTQSFGQGSIKIGSFMRSCAYPRRKCFIYSNCKTAIFNAR